MLIFLREGYSKKKKKKCTVNGNIASKSNQYAEPKKRVSMGPKDVTQDFYLVLLFISYVNNNLSE